VVLTSYPERQHVLVILPITFTSELSLLLEEALFDAVKIGASHVRPM